MLSYEELYDRFSKGRPWAELMRTTCLELARTDSVGTIEPESKLLDLLDSNPTPIPIVTAWSIVAGFRSPITGRVAAKTPAQFQRVSEAIRALHVVTRELVGVENERLVVATFLQYRKHFVVGALMPRNQYERLLYAGLVSSNPSYTQALVWLFDESYRAMARLPNPAKVLTEPYLGIYKSWLRK